MPADAMHRHCPIRPGAALRHALCDVMRETALDRAESDEPHKKQHDHNQATVEQAPAGRSTTYPVASPHGPSVKVPGRARRSRVRAVTHLAPPRRASLTDGTSGKAATREVLLYCRGFCAALDSHHQSADFTLFRAIADAHPELLPVLCSLKQDHSMIDRLMGSSVPRSTGPRRLRSLAATCRTISRVRVRVSRDAGCATGY